MELVVLEVKFSNNGREDTLYPVILRNKKDCILVDCGYPGFTPLLEAAANLHQLSLRELTGILITHHDVDHIGALYELKQLYPSLKVYASAQEERYISGKEKSLRLQQAESLYACMPEDQKEGALQFQELLKSVQPVTVDYTLLHRDEPYDFMGMQIIPTPGHTPGHISVYLQASKTLIAADAVVYEEGLLDIANPHFTLDLPRALVSVQQLLELDIHTLVCYHGGVVQSDIRNKLNDLVTRYKQQ